MGEWRWTFDLILLLVRGNSKCIAEEEKLILFTLTEIPLKIAHPHHTPLLNSSYSNLHNGANKFLTNKYINWNQISAWNENYYFYNYDFCRRFIKMKRNWTIMSEMDINGEECVSNFRYFFLQSLPVDRKILFLHNEDTLTLSNLL